jgi:hypothetical protein
VYFAASIALIGVCSPMLSGVGSYSCGDAASNAAQGSVQVFDALRPGMAVTYTFQAPSPDDRIVLVGHSIVADWCGHSSNFQTTWLLPTTVLSSGVSYVLRLVGGQVEVLGYV